ncbi:hypothetical protein F5878DRAFT_641527 [Lentinula raphanica]|uniref:Uncharacterized protein n=1 Tax=Lentinula raphanica TaxID=153919 RepID=A0AA38P9W6_9AGAR|nr:hypothetical protein F5878DRAFT_641527 [Lentinula raphanica]
MTWHSKLLVLAHHLGIVHVFLISTVSPVAEVLAAPIKPESSLLLCLPSMSCFLKFPCHGDEEEIDGAQVNVVPSSSSSSSGAGACEHKVDKNVPSSAIPAGMNWAPKTVSFVPSASSSGRDSWSSIVCSQ